MENVFGAIFPWSRAWWEIAAPSRILQPFFQASHRCIFSHGPKASHLIRPVVLVAKSMTELHDNCIQLLYVYNLFYKYEIRPLLARVETVSSQLSSKELPLFGPRIWSIAP